MTSERIAARFQFFSSAVGADGEEAIRNAEVAQYVREIAEEESANPTELDVVARMLWRMPEMTPNEAKDRLRTALRAGAVRLTAEVGR